MLDAREIQGEEVGGVAKPQTGDESENEWCYCVVDPREIQG